MPEIQDYECLVKVRACGFCNGTDMKIIDDEVSTTPVEYPVILGHEGVGEVVQVGKKVRNLHVGEVYLNPQGRIRPDSPFKSMWANMVEYGVLPDYQVMEELGIGGPRYGGSLSIPPEIDPLDGGVILTLKECFSGIRNFGIQPGQSVLVYGDGPVGLALVNFLRMAGAAWVGCVGHQAQRLQWIGSHSQPDMLINAHQESVQDRLGERRLDLVIDAVGSTAIIREASHLLKQGGKVGVLGVIKNKDASLSLLDLANHTSLHMLNWPYKEHATHDEIVGLILNGKIKPKDYYSHVMPIQEAPKAMEMIKTRQAFKVVLAM
ncbi:MAG: alcohol dehydrogenase catalytic domain-containing protein, partial [Deltaproteobacteria bacterium]|nr:alcohol dehydrogenase catalytic domain-containing protein [Deltaproteobacteria bacterium]